METLDIHLQKLRQLGDADLRLNSYVSDLFVSNPPHRVGIHHLVLKPRFLMADPTGTGKTPQMLVGYSFLKEKQQNIRMLVMTPFSALFQWHDAVKGFNVGIEPEVIGFTDKGKAKGRLSRYSAYENSTADVLLLSYQQMARDIDYILSNIENFIVVFDEAQTIKSANQKLLYPSAHKLSQKARYVWAATATPIMNRLEELYAIMDCVVPGIFGSLEHFKRTYYEVDWVVTSVKGRNRSIPVIKSYKNLPQLMQYMRPYYIKRPASVLIPYLPKLVTKYSVVEMGYAQAKTYEQIREKYFPGNAEFKARKLTKLASLTYAQMTADAPQVLGLEGGSVKADELLRLLQEELFDQKVIVYTRFVEVVNFLSPLLSEAGVKHVRITGAEANPLIREQNKKTFNESQDTNVILITDAGSEALNLQSAGVMLFFDMPWSWGKFLQILGRARRRNSKHSHILVCLLMVKGTIDEKVFTTLKVKEELVSATFGIDDSALDPVVLEQEDVVANLFDAVRDEVA